jgi:ion channel-forming bestrophin family protein
MGGRPTTPMRAYENPLEGHSFWRDALAWGPAITGAVLPRMVLFGLFAAGVSQLHRVFRWEPVSVTHLQYVGGFLALLLVLRTNAGYERWWEARKLWGGIVNQSRNLAAKGLAYGPADAAWRDRFVRWCAAFPHAARLSLRSQRETEDLERLLGPEDAAKTVAASHLPSYVTTQIAHLLGEARQRGELDGYAFLETDRERAALIDHIGGCERILRTPLPRVHSIKLRRFILLYMLALPFAIGSSIWWATVPVIMLVAYPLFAIDRIGQELENPFSQERQSHLPLDGICRLIEGNLMAFLKEQHRPGPPPGP